MEEWWEREPIPTVEWCLEHERHEQIPACEPENTEIRDLLEEMRNKQ